MDESEIAFDSKDFWFKVVGMLQQNWAIVKNVDMSPRCRVLFINDASGLFDQLDFSSISEAETALTRNGFARYAFDEGARRIFSPPLPPYRQATHPSGFIYSSGRYWK